MDPIEEETEGTSAAVSLADGGGGGRSSSNSEVILLMDLPKSGFFQASSTEWKSLEQIAQGLERSVPVRSNRYHLRFYRNTFIGSDCVDYLVRSGFASSRSEAVELGRQIAKEFVRIMMMMLLYKDGI